MEIEQRKIAEFVCSDLNDLGFPCEVIEDGTYRIWSRGIPYKIQKLKIELTEIMKPEKLDEFERLKNNLAVEYGKSRQHTYKEEQKKLKKDVKNANKK